MSPKNIRIIVAGSPISGKTTLALRLQQLLAIEGLTVLMVPDEHESPDYLDRHLNSLPERVKGLVDRGTKVIIEMRQTNCHGALPGERVPLTTELGLDS